MNVPWCICGFVLMPLLVTIGESAIALNTEKERVDLGASLRVDCTVSGGETFEGWFSPGGARVSDQEIERIHSDRNGDRYTLHVNNITVQDGGQYTCRGNTGNKIFLLWVTHIKVNTTQYLRIDGDAIIKVDVDGFPKPTVVWKKGNGELIPIVNDRYSVLEDFSLRISGMTPKDEGNYIFEVTQAALFRPFTIKAIAFSPPEIIQQPVPIKRYVTVGYNTSFTCIVTGFPKPTVQWINPGGREVDTFDPRYEIIGDTFYIYNIESNDKGNWTCRVTGGDVTIEAVATIIDVYTAPLVAEPSFPWVYWFELYRPASITCRANGKPPPTVVILKAGRIHPRMKMRPGAASIEFYLLREHDLGNYTCEAWGPARDSQGMPVVVNQSVALYTRDKPVINPGGSPKEIFSYVGNTQPVRINCDFISWPLANVTIWRGFYELTNGTDQATLYVWTYAWEDFGPYSCIGSNMFGEVNYTVWIRHATPPSKPENIEVNVTCDRAYFSWTPPSDTGGMDIERYVIDNGRGHRENTNDSYPLFYLWDLVPNTEYTITIRAMNRQGAGAPATVIFRTNATCVPKRPEVFSPVEYVLDRNFLDLRWKAPSNAKDWDGLYYRILVKDKEDYTNIGNTKVYSSIERVQRIGGLQRNMTYEIILWAVTPMDHYSEPTFTHYFVHPNAWGAAHALTASLWSILLAALIALSMRS
ncbi:neural cell adhesion molecule 2 [Nematostella vectensis]|uniref:neural cell adhesion molecule 2 n=1 Tax=Nematostella vectensis TaxID=45351 RepID=UPI00138FC145|nr:neural cell adhesion molecule 2 [Nematostella vectensis]